MRGTENWFVVISLGPRSAACPETGFALVRVARRTCTLDGVLTARAFDIPRIRSMNETRSIGHVIPAFTFTLPYGALKLCI